MFVPQQPSFFHGTGFACVPYCSASIEKVRGPCYLNEPLWGLPGVGVGCKTEVRSGCNGERNGNMVAVRSGGLNWIGVGCGDDLWLPNWGISYFIVSPCIFQFNN